MFKKKIVLLLLCHLLPMAAKAHLISAEKRHPFYIGVTAGFGSTTWQGLVPSRENQNAALIISTPQSVKEGGLVGGVYAGYEFIPTFALEAIYQRYPNAIVNFDAMSLVAFQYGLTQLTTRTETAALMAKIMLFIPNSTIRAFSSAGAAGVHRWDQLTDYWRVSPTFGLGLNYNFNEHIMGEIGLGYTGGYGESELNPAEDYVPFLYSAYLRIAYRI